MASGAALEGLFVPVVTPLRADGSLDEAALESLVAHYLDAGVDGIVALGTTGEPHTLAPAERRRVVETCARVCRERGAPFVVGPGSNDTAATIAEVRALSEVEGVAAALCVVPYYTRPGRAGAVAHLEAVASASPVPIVCYNFPARTAQQITASDVLRLAEHPNVVGVKQSLPLDADGLAVLAGAPPGFAVLSGDDDFILASILLGGSGAISALAHVCTDRVVGLVAAARAGELAEARRHHDALLAVNAALLAEPPPTVLKGVLFAQDRIASPLVRLPLLPASPGAVGSALEAIEAAGG